MSPAYVRRPNNREHTYSNSTPAQPGSDSVLQSSSPINGKSTEPLVQLKDTTREFLDNLMMEGDLLEVSLDETNHLWRLLIAAKPTMSDLSYMYTKYNITVKAQLFLKYQSFQQLKLFLSSTKPGHTNENLVKESKKRKSTDLGANLTSSGKKASAKKAASGAGGKDTSIVTNGETNVLTPQNKNTTANKKGSLLDDANKDDSANDEHETEAEDHTEDGDASGRQPRKKLKRGRKLKVLKDNNEASPIGAGGAVAGVVGGAGGQNSLKKKKPRKTTKNVNKKAMNQSMTSDEDEECSASNCSRPPGKKTNFLTVIFIQQETNF